MFIVVAKIRVTVDGGTNRWLDWLRKHNLQDKLPPPELITGDLDSCRKESRAFFNTSTIIETPDQDATDFTKSLQVLEPYILELSLDSIVAVCETSGRIDQIHANENSECQCCISSFQISEKFLRSTLQKQFKTSSIPSSVHVIYKQPVMADSSWKSLNNCSKRVSKVLVFAGALRTNKSYYKRIKMESNRQHYKVRRNGQLQQLVRSRQRSC